MNNKKLKPCSLRKALKLIGGTDIRISKNHMYDSGFFILDTDLYYANVSEVNIDGKYIMIRKAKNRQDYTGGINEWWVDSYIQSKGYRFDTTTLKNKN